METPRDFWYDNVDNIYDLMHAVLYLNLKHERELKSEVMRSTMQNTPEVTTGREGHGILMVQHLWDETDTAHPTKVWTTEWMVFNLS